MIPVRPAAEPAGFDAAVRRPGLQAIAELVGETPPRTAGQRHRKVAESREEIPAVQFPPYWREALGDLLARYHACMDGWMDASKERTPMKTLLCLFLIMTSSGCAMYASRIKPIPAAPDVLLLVRSLDCFGLEVAQHRIGVELDLWSELYEQAQNAQLSAGLATAGIAVSPPSSPLVAANRSNIQRADQQIASLPSVPVMKVYIGQLKGTSEAIAKEWITKDCATAANREVGEPGLDG